MNSNDTFGMFDEMWKLLDSVSSSSRTGFSAKRFVYGEPIPKGNADINWESFIYPAPSFPPVNIEIDEDNKDLYFTFALAGFAPEEVSLRFDGDSLVLSSIKEEKKEEKKHMFRRGIRDSNFSYKYTVPVAKYNVEITDASFKDGLLKVHIPAREETKPKKIEIKTS